ncbi:MAG: 50S ribosomal protein L21 [Firmicutes bacterium]|nr:50S ribosomal protein L21 [Bacillota bacterium]
MYAVIRFGGKQYKVSKGEVLVVDRVQGNPGDKFDIPEILMVRDNNVLVSGLDKAKVVASIVEHFRGDKVLVFKYKPKKNYRRLFGHRSYLSKIKIEDIEVPKAKVSKKEESQIESTEATA